jgi:hypothetical protein
MTVYQANDAEKNVTQANETSPFFSSQHPPSPFPSSQTNHARTPPQKDRRHGLSVRRSVPRSTPLRAGVKHHDERPPRSPAAVVADFLPVPWWCRCRGRGRVGKSSLVARYVDGPAQNIDSYHPTIEQIKHKNVKWSGQEWDLEVVDTAGQVSHPIYRFHLHQYTVSEGELGGRGEKARGRIACSRRRVRRVWAAEGSSCRRSSRI